MECLIFFFFFIQHWRKEKFWPIWKICFKTNLGSLVLNIFVDNSLIYLDSWYPLHITCIFSISHPCRWCITVKKVLFLYFCLHFAFNFNYSCIVCTCTYISLKLYCIKKKKNKFLYLFARLQNQTLDCVSDFSVDSRHRKRIFKRTINTSPQRFLNFFLCYNTWNWKMSFSVSHVKSAR